MNQTEKTTTPCPSCGAHLQPILVQRLPPTIVPGEGPSMAEIAQRIDHGPPLDDRTGIRTQILDAADAVRRNARITVKAYGATAVAERPYDYDCDEVPDQLEVYHALRLGIADDVALVGKQVLYQTDGRGKLDYFLPAVVTCVQRSHPDLPLLRGAQEAGRVVESGQEFADGDVARSDRGFWMPNNPVPIPLDGTVHLHVLTPGPQMHYTEFSVPYNARHVARTWRFHPDDIPF